MNRKATKMVSMLALYLLVVFQIQGQSKEMFERKVYTNQANDSLRYRILLPEGYDGSQAYPLVVFLHGAGERGNDNEKQLTHGADLFLNEDNRKNHPAIVVFPQCPDDKYWIDISIRDELFGQGDPDFDQSISKPSEQLSLVNELVDELMKKENIDSDRVYIMGLSMGGFGTFETLGRYPEKYAAAIAICGGGNLELAENYAGNTSIWITHGAQDDVVPVILSQRIYKKLQELDADVTYTEFADANHNAWDPTFEIPELMPWLFSKSKQQ
ncbi:carboxylesterase family protein [Litoribacter ruber]|uniref:carboxylesterase family protein n=1 Tax=Litoribacter ruber TaxID=702568 RepID=UPI001FEA7EA7|nr:prolyl oligopeptidase family serine peptidase [Litoribacter ruber]